MARPTMSDYRKCSLRSGGFTIVELLIVIVVIGILASITVVAFNGVQNRARETALKSDLNNAAKLLEISVAQNNGTVPTSLPSDLRTSPDTSLSLSQTSTGYCVNGTHQKVTDLQLRYDSQAGGVREGLCGGAVIAGTETGGVKPNLITNTDFSSGWNMNLQVSTGRTLSNRAGATGDPFPTRPVLVLTNSSTTATNWAVLQNSSITRADIVAGKTYTISYYVRSVGNYNGSTTLPGVMDGNATNKAINTGAAATVSTSWQRVQGNSAGIATALSSNQLYMPLSNAAFTTSGWSLEFQGFELREQ